MTTISATQLLLLLLCCCTASSIVFAATPGYGDDNYNPANIASDFLAQHPITEPVTCSQAVGFERDVITLGNVVGKRARVDFFAKLVGLQKQWITQIRRIGRDRDLNEVLNALQPELQKLWTQVVDINTLVRKQFLVLHSKGAELLVRSGALAPEIVRRLIGIYDQLPVDIDKISTRNEAEFHRISRHFRQVADELEATVRAQRLDEAVLQWGAEALWRLLVAEEADLLADFSAGALEVHHVADARAEKEVLGLAKCQVAE